MVMALGAGCTRQLPLAPACRPWQGSDSSSEPPSHCFFFPSSIAIDPLGDILYVANTNNDVSFGGATIVAVDLLRHERAVECFRRFGREDGGDSDCGVVSCAASGWSLGREATVENTERTEAQSGKPAKEVADFDRCYCERDLDDSNIVNCEAQRFVLADQTVKIGNYPAGLSLLAEDPPNWDQAARGGDGQRLLHRGLYVSVQGDPSITLIDVTRPIFPGRTANDDPGVRMDCGVDSGPARHLPGEPYALRQCSDNNRVQQTPPDDVVLIDPNNPEAGTQPRFQVPAEPRTVHIDRGCVESGFRHDRGTFYANDPAQNPKSLPPCYRDDGMGGCQRGPDGKCLAGTYYQYLVASHLSPGRVSSYDLGKNPLLPVPPTLKDVSEPLMTAADSSGRRGGFGLAPRISGDLSQPWYLTSRFTGSIATFRLASAAGPRIVPGLSLSISNQFSVVPINIREDVRDFVFSQDGSRAFAALFTPPALAILDTKTRGGNGVPINQVENIVNLCPGPSKVVVAEVPRISMGAAVRQTLVYVTCYYGGQVAEVDAENGEVLATIPIGRGPESLVLNFGPGSRGAAVDPCADPYVGDAEAKRRGVTCPSGQTDLRPRPPRPQNTPGPIGPRAYVSTYLDNAIAVLDLDPRGYRRVVSRIGLPIPKQVQ